MTASTVGFLPITMATTALAAFHKSGIDKWWPLIKETNIRIE